MSTSPAPYRIVFANEKGGTGKSTTAVHVAVALAFQGARVAAIDLDHRQRSFARYFENRAATALRRGVALPMAAVAVCDAADAAGFEAACEATGAGHDFLVIDTPGRDDPVARHAAMEANTLVTPLNDSFLDLDLIGQVDPETFKIRRLSFYAEAIWEARKGRATRHGGARAIEWVVARNRTGFTDARNMRRIEGALKELAGRAGFRLIGGLSERVIYRELFPSGLTLLDRGQLGELGTSHLVARQELRALIANLRLPMSPAAQGELPVAAPALATASG